MSTRIDFLNGEFVGEDKLVVSVRDVGYSRGYAVFDFLRTYPHHRPFKLDKHIDRLYNSAKLVNLHIPWTKEQVADWILQTLDKNTDRTEKTIKIIISGGVSDTMLPSNNPTIAIVVDPRHEYPKEMYEKGVSVISVKYDRYIPKAKTNNYIEGMKQTQIAEKVGAIEPIYYDEKQVFEGSNSNIFAVIDNKLLTPKTDILSGITREVLLEILHLNIPATEQDFTMEQLLKADEVFLTSSSREIAPVVKIDDHQIGDGMVGKITKEVMRQFNDYTSSDTW